VLGSGRGHLLNCGGVRASGRWRAIRGCVGVRVITADSRGSLAAICRQLLLYMQDASRRIINRMHEVEMHVDSLSREVQVRDRELRSIIIRTRHAHSGSAASQQSSVKLGNVFDDLSALSNTQFVEHVRSGRPWIVASAFVPTVTDGPARSECTKMMPLSCPRSLKRKLKRRKMRRSRCVSGRFWVLTPAHRKGAISAGKVSRAARGRNHPQVHRSLTCGLACA
jgi:hypothetical protein